MNEVVPLRFHRHAEWTQVESTYIQSRKRWRLGVELPHAWLVLPLKVGHLRQRRTKTCQRAWHRTPEEGGEDMSVQWLGSVALFLLGDRAVSPHFMGVDHTKSLLKEVFSWRVYRWPKLVKCVYFYIFAFSKPWQRPNAADSVLSSSEGSFSLSKKATPVLWREQLVLFFFGIGTMPRLLPSCRCQSLTPLDQTRDRTHSPHIRHWFPLFPGRDWFVHTCEAMGRTMIVHLDGSAGRWTDQRVSTASETASNVSEDLGTAFVSGARSY